LAVGDWGIQGGYGWLTAGACEKMAVEKADENLEPPGLMHAKIIAAQLFYCPCFRLLVRSNFSSKCVSELGREIGFVSRRR